MSPETRRADLNRLINEKVVASCWLNAVGSSVGALYQKLYIQSKSAPEDGRICRPKHVGLIQKD